MIGYRISEADLTAQVNAESANWSVRAQQRTQSFRAAGRYDESSSIWSEVKAVYMRLQGRSKCAYCERQLESVELGKGEQDVEHFRPKKRIVPWPVPADLKKVGVTTAPVPPARDGYHLLPYHLFNYSAACKPCNSALKRDFFPVATAHDTSRDDPVALLAEGPLLIYPIGDFDSDPEDLIAFNGLSPFAIPADGYPRHRALVTIAFFKLDDVSRRKNLFRERAQLLGALFGVLRTASGATPGSPANRVRANQLAAAYTSSNAPHANCMRSFKRLYAKDPDAAAAIADIAAEFVIRGS